MQGQWKETGRALVNPIVRALHGMGVTPNQVTVAGLFLAIVAGILAGLGYLRLTAACLILSSLCDLLDGQLARRSGKAGPLGAFLDSCFDRLAEGAVYLGLIIHFGATSPLMASVAGVALIGSFMVSYARARAEGLRFTCQVGWMERPERLMVLIIGLLAGGWVLTGGLVLLAILSMVTFLQRVAHVVRVATDAGQPPEGDSGGTSLRHEAGSPDTGRDTGAV